MITDKISRKYFGLAWLALFLTCLVRNIYGIYLDISSITEPGRAAVIWAVISIVLDGAIPAVVTFVCALVVWQIGFYKYVRFISRNDFCTLVMFFTSAVKFVIGIIEAFAILDPDVYVFTSTVLDIALEAGAMLAMFFLVIPRMYRPNPVEKYNAFKMWAIVYMIAAGLAVLGQNVLILMLSDGSSFSKGFLSVLNEYGYQVNAVFSDIQIASSAIAVVIYLAYLAAIIVLGEMMRKKSRMFQDPETRGDYYDESYSNIFSGRSDTDRTFPDVFDELDPNDDGSKDDKVFDEFDL